MKAKKPTTSYGLAVKKSDMKKSSSSNKVKPSKSMSSRQPLDSIASANSGSGYSSKSGMPSKKNN